MLTNPFNGMVGTGGFILLERGTFQMEHFNYVWMWLLKWDLNLFEPLGTQCTNAIWAPKLSVYLLPLLTKQLFFLLNYQHNLRLLGWMSWIAMQWKQKIATFPVYNLTDFFFTRTNNAYLTLSKDHCLMMLVSQVKDLIRFLRRRSTSICWEAAIYLFTSIVGTTCMCAANAPVHPFFKKAFYRYP